MVLKQLSSKRMLRIKKSFPGQIPPDSAAGAAIGYFDIDEIILGKDNPCHENCQVRDIKGFNLSRDSDFHLTKKLIAQQAANTKQQGYTIKTIKNSSFTDCPRQHFEKAAAHLANEASMMTVLRHKNIAKIRGIASSGTEAYYETGRHDAYFIITDTLNESLPSKLDVWRRNQRKLQMRHPSKTSNVKERLQIAYSLADALEYLHELGIVHRRIHPNFVGFNSIDQLQLHGFGDAIRWTRKVKKSVPQNRYSPSDRIASPASDVYSFSKLLCEIITLCKIQEDGLPKNPLLYVAECHYWSRKLPKSLFECVQRGLSDDIRKRPTMTEMKACIDGALLCMEIQGECAPKDTTNLLKRWRKSFARIKDIDIALPTL